jgi:nucleoside-diphosphate-sugar epimerase
VRIVITGASGNIGTALLRRLGAEADQHQVVGVCRRPPSGGFPYDGVEWVSIDLADVDAFGQLLPVLDGADAVVHLAWGFQPSRDVEYLRRLDVGGSAAVLEAARKAGVAHLVHMSSLGAYTPRADDAPVDESWPTEGITTLAYSEHKVAVERALDRHEAAHPDAPLVTRLRPGVVAQRDAGSALLRYALPDLLPAGVLKYVPVLPVDRSLVFQCVHADDVADAVVRVLQRRPGGAFNLVADPPITRDDIAEALGARPVHVDRRVLRAVVALGWRTRVQSLDPGWIDLAFAVPLMDAGRAHRELEWHPRVDARDALADALAGMATAASAPSEALRPRSVPAQLINLLRHGPTGDRRLP